MKNFLALGFLVSLVLGSGCGDLIAAEINPNGFPSGTHYNLNIHGKADGFSCPAQEYLFGQPVYGNSVFVPENGQGSIFVESGKTGGKAATITELQATDPCAFDNNGATVKLPPNPNGYRVYARVLAKPTDEPSIGLYSSLNFVQDENGNDLLYLGQVTSQGFETPSFSFTRTKGQSKAVDISGMFQWSGTVCYFAEPTDGFSSTGVACCVDSNADDIFEECMSATGEPSTCPAGYEQVTTYCKTFTAEWIFNVSDYVSLLLGTSNSGVKLLQIRFYPN